MSQDKSTMIFYKSKALRRDYKGKVSVLGLVTFEEADVVRTVESIDK